MTVSRTPCTTTNASPTEFNFPYAHEESEDRGDLRSLGRAFAEDTLTDPLE